MTQHLFLAKFKDRRYHLFMPTMFIFSFIFALTLATNANAASSTLTWNEAINETVRNNSEVQSAEEALKSNRYTERAAYSTFLPQINANLALNRGQSQLSFGDNASGSNLYSATLTGNWNIFNGFQDWGRIEQADANTRVSALNAQITKAKVSYDLKSAYENLRYAIAYKKLTQEIIRRREENLRLVDLRFESGRENKGSVLLSRAYAEQARYDDLQAYNNQLVSSAQLARTLGRDENEELMAVDDIPGDPPEKVRPNFSELAQSVPEYRQSEAREEGAAAAVTVARSQFLPALNLSGTLGKLDTEFFPEQRDRWAFGVVLSYPLFMGGRDYNTTRSALAAESSARLTRVNLRRDVVSKLEQAFANYQQAVVKFKVDESFKNAAQTRAEIARKRYNNGLMTFEDWDVIENDLITRQKTYLQSRRDRILAEASWEQALGKGVLP